MTMNTKAPLSDMSAALAAANRLTFDATGKVVPSAQFRSELREMQPMGSGRCGNKPPLDARQKAQVRQMRRQGFALLDIARKLGTSYHRVQQVD